MAIQSGIAAFVFDIAALSKKATIVRLLLLAAVVTVASPARAQTLTVLHNFSGAEGSQPNAGLTIDGAGNLYGTASLGGYTGGTCYTVPFTTRWSLCGTKNFARDTRGKLPGLETRQTLRQAQGPPGAQSFLR